MRLCSQVRLGSVGCLEMSSATIDYIVMVLVACALVVIIVVMAGDLRVAESRRDDAIGALRDAVELAELEREANRLCNMLPAVEPCVPCPIPPG